MQETGKENAKQDRKNNKKKWMILAVCAFAAAILLIGFIAGTWWMEKKAEQEYLAMQEKNAEKRQKVPEEEKKIDIPVDFDSLQKENPDIYAWITIPDTVIDYPIVQSSEDNAYYLNHSAEKTDSVSGAIYSENYNKKNFDDPITLLYGHNMKDGSMFASLEKYQDKQYGLDHSQFTLYLENEVRKYNLMAVLHFELTPENINQYYKIPESRVEFENYVDFLEEKSLYCGGYSATWGDQLLTLSTCDNKTENGRILVVAKEL